MNNVDERSERKIQECAYLASLGENQESIGKHLGISQATVSRNLDAACVKGWLRKDWIFQSSNITDRRLNELQQRWLYLQGRSNLEQLQGMLRSLIKTKTGSPKGPEVVVLPVGTTSGQDLRRLDIFARLASHVVASKLRLASAVCCSWGRTVSLVVNSVAEAWGGVKRKPKGEVPVIPARGEPFDNLGNHDVSASRNAERLFRILNPGHHEQYPYSLSAIPALIPKDLTVEEEAALRKYFSRVPAYREAFGTRLADEIETGHVPIIQKADCVLVSVGGVTPASEFTQACLSVGFDEADFGNVTGDMSGVFVGPDGCDQELITGMNRRWVGIEEDDLRRIAKKKPGVIVVAAEQAEKANTLLQCVLKLEAISTMIIDEVVAAELERLIKEERRLC